MITETVLPTSILQVLLYNDINKTNQNSLISHILYPHMWTHTWLWIKQHLPTRTIKYLKLYVHEIRLKHGS